MKASALSWRLGCWAVGKLENGGVAKFLALAAVAAKGFNYIAKSKSRSRGRSQSQTAGVLEKVSQDAGLGTQNWPMESPCLCTDNFPLSFP